MKTPTSLRDLIRYLLPIQVRRQLWKVHYWLRFVDNYPMAAFALRIKVTLPPSTFHHKVLHKMAFDENPMLTIYADKVKVREYVRKQVGSKYLTTSYGTFDRLKNSHRSLIPRNFVIKANHGSGASVICWEGAPRGNTIPKDLTLITWEKFLIHPDDLDWQDLIRLTSKWMSLNYFWTIGKYPERAYRNIQPLILVEELLLKSNNLPFDYKFQMINGKCSFIQVDSQRFGAHQRSLFSADWKVISARTPYPPISECLPSPDSLPEMLKVAEALSKETDFIRVDLYDLESRVLFGELTNYPNSGVSEIWPRGLSIELARGWFQSYK